MARICSSTRSSTSGLISRPQVYTSSTSSIGYMYRQVPNDGRAPVNPQFERGDHTEEARARAAGGPVQVGVVLGVAVDLFAVGSDNLKSKHAFTCRSEHLAVPAVSALQQIAAEANAFAMARREEEPLRVEFGRKDAGDLARPDVRGHPICVDGAVVEAADVEQQTAVAQMTGRPAVPARTYADFVAVGARIADRCDHVVGVVSLHDHVGKAVRQKAIPHRRPTGRLVSFRAAEVVLFDGKQNHCVPLISHSGGRISID